MACGVFIPRAIRTLVLAVCLLLVPGSSLWAAEPARRIVSLDWGLTETLLALGVVPVAVADVPGYRGWVVEPALPEGVVDLGSRFEPNLEQLQQLKPDLILATPYQNPLKPLLERIAPVETIAIYEEDASGRDNGNHPLERAIAATRHLGSLINRQSEAEALIANTDALFTAARQRLETAGAEAHRPLYIATSVDERHVWLYARNSLFQDVFDRLGLSNAWQAETNFWGFSSAGYDELADAPEARLLLLRPLPSGVEASLARNPLWNALPFVRAQRVALIDPVLMFGTLPASGRFARLLVLTLTGAPL